MSRAEGGPSASPPLGRAKCDRPGTYATATPVLYAVCTRHGLIAEDVVLMPIVLLVNAGTAVGYLAAAARLVTWTAPAHIALYQEHQQKPKVMP